MSSFNSVRLGFQGVCVSIIAGIGNLVGVSVDGTPLPQYLFLLLVEVSTGMLLGNIAYEEYQRARNQAS